MSCYIIFIDSPNVKMIRVVGRCFNSKDALAMLGYYRQIYFGQDVKLSEVAE